MHTRVRAQLSSSCSLVVTLIHVCTALRELLAIPSMRNLPKTDFIGTCDPYITVHLGASKLLRTDARHTRNPDYDYKYEGLVCHRAKSIRFKIKDLDVDGSQVSDAPS